MKLFKGNYLACACPTCGRIIYDDGSDAQMWLDSLVKEDLRQPLDCGAMTEDERSWTE